MKSQNVINRGGYAESNTVRQANTLGLSLLSNKAIEIYNLGCYRLCLEHSARSKQ